MFGWGPCIWDAFDGLRAYRQKSEEETGWRLVIIEEKIYTLDRA